MSSANLAVHATETSLSVSDIQRHQTMIYTLMKEAMVKGVDYGVTPGTLGKKPSLYKSGSEKILAMFRLAVDVLVEEINPASNIGRFDEYRIRVYVTLKEMVSGRFIGKGMGEASTFEEKYLWRRAAGEQEYSYYEKINPEYVRIKFVSEWNNGRTTGKEFQEKQVRVPTADRINTVLKIAKKRAQIDSTLTATAASAIFTQDLEDMADYLREAIDENQEIQEGQSPSQPVERKKPQRKSEAGKAASSSASLEDAKKNGDEPKRERHKDCISEPQERMLWAVARKKNLSETDVHDIFKHSFKDREGKALEHSYDMPWRDLQRFLDGIDPDFEHHTESKRSA